MNDVLPIVSSGALLTEVDREDLPGAGLINSLGLVSALLLVQEQSAQGLPTLSPVQLALDALTLDILNLEPGLVSLSGAVPPGLLASLQGEAQTLPWSDLLGQAQSLANELGAGGSPLGDSPLPALGLESLGTLLGDLQVLDTQLPDALDMVSLDGLAGVLPVVDGAGVPAGLLEDLQLPGGADGVGGPDDAGDLLSQALADLSGGDGTGVDALISPVTDLVSSGSTELPSPVIDAPEAVAPVTSPVQDVVADVLPPVESLVALVPDLVEPVVDGVVEVLDEVTDVVEPIVALIDTTTDVVADVVGDLLTSPDQLADTLVDGVDQVVDAVGAVVDGTTDLLQGTTEVVTGVVTDTVDNLLGATGSTDPLAGAGDLLAPVTDLLTGGGETTPLVDAVVGVVEEPSTLIDQLIEPVTEVVGGLSDPLPTVEEVVADVPLVSDLTTVLTSGTLPLVQEPSGQDGGGTLGGLLG